MLAAAGNLSQLANYGIKRAAESQSVRIIHARFPSMGMRVNTHTYRHMGRGASQQESADGVCGGFNPYNSGVTHECSFHAPDA